METIIKQELTTLKDGITRKRNWLIAIGVVMIIAGMAAIAFPHVSSLGVSFTIGFIMVIAGIANAISAFSYPKWQGMVLNLIISVLWAVAGIYLLTRPMDGLFALTILVAAAFIAEGILKAIFSFQLRPLSGWGWMLFSGIIAAALGIMLMMQFPLSALWALGTLAGINILISGWSLVMIAIAVSKLIEKKTTAIA